MNEAITPDEEATDASVRSEEVQPAASVGSEQENTSTPHDAEVRSRHRCV